MNIKIFFSACLTVAANLLMAQELDILPPVQPWNGKSIGLIAKNDNPWITPVEKSNFKNTPSYQETKELLEKMCSQSKVMKMISIGKTPQGRDILMVIVSSDGNFDKDAIKKSGKPLLLMQGGIHAGEIDGKDAGLMLLRDIAFGSKKDLIKNVNLLFIPILNVDGHERTSPYNRVNQRGPDNMGWRTNSRNLNLNRDYAKLDTKEVRAVVQVMNDYDPSLYLDLHVTDGADYQYDITYGYSSAYSPSIAAWLTTTLRPFVDDALRANGHIPGPLMFAANDRDFSKGNIEYPFEARFSNNYGDLRHLPSILLENHSLKPFRQRVLGTYIFLESIIKVLDKNGSSLKTAIANDRSMRSKQVVLKWRENEKPDTMQLLGIESRLEKSTVTAQDFVIWTGKPVVQKIPYIKNTTPERIVSKPVAYWVPATYSEVIERLRMHGVKMEEVTTPKEIDVQMRRITEYKFAPAPFEGHFAVSTSKVAEERQREKFYEGTVRIPTDQPLGDLVTYLLEPLCSDSFFSWGFFPEIFNRTEYIEEYAIDPLARNMLASNPQLKKEFEDAQKSNPEVFKNPQAVYEWFYARSPYVDNRYLLYPVGIEMQ